MGFQLHCGRGHHRQFRLIRVMAQGDKGVGSLKMVSFGTWVGDRAGGGWTEDSIA